MRRIIGILPFHLHDRWRTQVQRAKDSYRTVDFPMLVDFVKMEARKLNHPIYGRDQISSDRPDNARKPSQQDRRLSNFKGSNTGVTYAPQGNHPTSSSNNNSTPHKQCLYCDDKAHCLDTCHKLSNRPFNERLEFLKSKGLCFGCLKTAHRKANCRNKSTCTVCNYRHPTVLHITKEATIMTSVESSTSTSETEEPVLNSHVGHVSGEYTFSIIPVCVRIKGHVKEVQTYAFLDPGSNVTFCSDNLMTQLGGISPNHEKTRIAVDTMGKQQVMDAYSIKGVEISDLKHQHTITIPQVFTKDKIPTSIQHIPRMEDTSVWPHLDDVPLPQINASVDLLIGNNVPDAYSPLEVKTGPSGSPHACKTRLGWVVWNLTRIKNPTNLQVNQAEVTAISQLQEDEPVDRFMQKDSNMERRIDDCCEESVEDQGFSQKINESLQLKDGHHKIGLPFTDEPVPLTHNEKQSQRDDHLHTEYASFLDEIIKQEYAEYVTAEDLHRDDGRLLNSPHYSVHNPNKLDKMRVVFNYASSCCDVSLNQLLHQGPDLTNNLLSVLLKFILCSEAAITDIPSMLYQVQAKRDDVDCLHYVYKSDDNRQTDHVPRRMLIHLFGAVLSPTYENLALPKSVEEYHHLYNSDVHHAANEYFYVYDCVMPIDTDEHTAAVARNVADLCNKGGFHLTKWSSNSRSVLLDLPVEERASHLRNLDLEQTLLPMERALGVYWCAESDRFSFRVIDKGPLESTRRNILSVVCSLFDPLGLASPFVLKAKFLLQDLCRRKLSWDQLLEGDDLVKWQSWLNGVMKLNMFIFHDVSVPLNLVTWDPYTFICLWTRVTFALVSVMKIQLMIFPQACMFKTLCYVVMLDLSPCCWNHSTSSNCLQREIFENILVSDEVPISLMISTTVLLWIIS